MENTKKVSLIEKLKSQMKYNLSGGIYYITQIQFAYNSNRIEGSRLSQEQTRYLFETRSLITENYSARADDIITALNHFKCFKILINRYDEEVSEELAKTLHKTLVTGTTITEEDWFVVGDYKKEENEVGDITTALPAEVPHKMLNLLKEYNDKKNLTFDDLLDFHWKFECIHPFQDGNGRVGRLLLFKECLRNGITPFIIQDDLKAFYYRGLKNWPKEKGYLRDTCLRAQDIYAAYLDRFKVEHSEDDYGNPKKSNGEQNLIRTTFRR